MVKRIITVIALSLVFALPAAAKDYEKGLAAQKRGDFATALRIWQPLAERGDAAAQNQVGLLYDNGEGVPQDHARALAWYRKAARQGHADAQYNLGLMYANGLAVQQDYDTALMWYRKAADQGHREAKVNLDVLYLMGHVTRKDDGGNVRAQRARSELNKLKSAIASTPKTAKPQKLGGSSVDLAVARTIPAAETGSPSAEDEHAAAEARDARSTDAETGASVKPPDAAPDTKTASGQSVAAVAKPVKGKSKPSVAASGDFRVQLGSVRTKLRAMKEASRLKQAHESLLGPLDIEPVRADLGDRGVFYRLRAGPLSDRDSASALCRALSSRNQGCIVVKK